MAKSPSHALGQIIGYAMEQAFFTMLQPIAAEFDLFLDRQGPREAREKKKKVTWVDENGNKHDLDFVLERSGTESTLGKPVAFIESAWRRYTKHSVNKAAEISQALVPLRRTHHVHRPFLGALVAGEWTEGGIKQMESQGVAVLYLPRQMLIDAFSSANIDLDFDEGTKLEHLALQVEKWSKLDNAAKNGVLIDLQTRAARIFATFSERLRQHLSRTVEEVQILHLRGNALTADSVPEALEILSGIDSAETSTVDLTVHRFEIAIRYSNDDQVQATFSSIQDAIIWLEAHAPAKVSSDV